MAWFSRLSFRLGRKSPERMEEAVRRLLGEGDLAAVIPYLAGRGVDLEEALEEYETYLTIEWLRDPVGPPPSVKVAALRELLRRAEPLVDSELLEQMGGEGLVGEDEL